MFFETEIAHVLNLVLRSRRKELTMEQSKVAQRAALSQATVSMWEKVPNPDETRTLGRDSLKQLITMGLQFSYEEADAILWLAGVSTLSVGEVKDCIEPYEPTVTFRQRLPQDYENIIRRMLNHVEQTLQPRSNIAARVFSAAPDHWNNFDESVRKLSAEGQPRMSVLSVPPSYTRPLKAQERLHRRYYSDLNQDASASRDLLNALRQDYELRDGWMEHGITFRTIIERRAIEHYFQQGKQGNLALTREEVKEQGQRWIELLDRADNYFLAIKDTPVLMSYQLFGLSALIIIGTSLPRKEQVSGGIRGIRIDDPSIVLHYRLEFENEWEKLPAVNENRDEVKNWLRQQIK